MESVPRWLYAVLLVVIAVIVVFGTVYPRAAFPAMQTRVEPLPRITERVIARDDDALKPGALRSVMGQLEFAQDARTTGVSPDTLRFRFDEPARIVGVLISVDIRHLDLVEFAVGINPRTAYGLEARDWLIHVSDSGGRNGSKIDEQAWFGDGFSVGPDDFIGVGAWIWNGDTVELSVSPELIIYYEWLP